MKIQHGADLSQFYIVKDDFLSQGCIKFNGVSRNLMLLLLLVSLLRKIKVDFVQKLNPQAGRSGFMIEDRNRADSSVSPEQSH